MFAAKVANEKRIPFEVCADPFYSEANIAYLRESIRQIEEGKAEVHDLIEV
jgi:DNA-damage-inducible protein J